MLCPVSPLLPFCLTTTLTWDVWMLIILSESLLVFVLLSDKSMWNLGQFISYGLWLLLSQTCYSVFCQSWSLYWHKSLSWVCYSWVEIVKTTSKFNFWFSFDISLFILTSSPQTWYSEVSQPIWAPWFILASISQEKNTSSWSLLFFMGSGALALEAFLLCPKSTMMLLVWAMVFWAVFYFSHLGMKLDVLSQPYSLFLLLGLNLSPMVLQEYLWILLMGQSCILCATPWSGFLYWSVLEKMIPLFAKNSKVPQMCILEGMLVFFSFMLTFFLF